MTGKQPEILVLSSPDDTVFKYCTLGWFAAADKQDPKVVDFVARATACIEAGSTISDVVDRLRDSGFDVVWSKT